VRKSIELKKGSDLADLPGVDRRAAGRQAFQLRSTGLPHAGQVCFRFFAAKWAEGVPRRDRVSAARAFSGPALPAPPSAGRLMGVSLRTMA